MEGDGFVSDEARSVAFHLQAPAENYVNDPEVEFLWAMKAVEHAEVHFNLVRSVDPRTLRLTEQDDKMYSTFEASFPDFQLSPLIEDQLKSADAKEKWREWMKPLETEVADFNYATLLRIDAAGDYSENNTLIVPRLEFLVIEVARNRRGFNDGLRGKFPPTAAATA
ncbi:putative Protein PBDC1 [Hypsibius exemplaris]|uniref:Polysaccharide biosynthesis domain-containing protein n=1 Tax=Hypsibius exemplaris TaxID=2072580 RepID=A0A1W0WMB1_HYPEX|nr:putative Protein PBDC1 [Hypsibius exemplaris]